MRFFVWPTASACVLELSGGTQGQGLLECEGLTSKCWVPGKRMLWHFPLNSDNLVDGGGMNDYENGFKGKHSWFFGVLS